MLYHAKILIMEGEDVAGEVYHSDFTPDGIMETTGVTVKVDRVFGVSCWKMFSEQVKNAIEFLHNERFNPE